jgi:hypothetical protein
MNTLHICVDKDTGEHRVSDAIWELGTNYRPMNRRDLVTALSEVAGTLHSVPPDAKVEFNGYIVSLKW